VALFGEAAGAVKHISSLCKNVALRAGIILWDFAGGLTFDQQRTRLMGLGTWNLGIADSKTIPKRWCNV